MIHEEATMEAFRYYASEIRPERGIPIIASCELCGKFRIVVRYGYRTFCFSCLAELERRPDKCICLECGKVFCSSKSVIKLGGGKYCSRKCYLAIRFKGGKKENGRRHKAKRRKLGYVLLLPLKGDEVGHHVTDEYVIGIPEDIHICFSGYSRKKHRALILKWLRDNDKKKYKKAISVLNKH